MSDKRIPVNTDTFNLLRDDKQSMTWSSYLKALYAEANEHNSNEITRAEVREIVRDEVRKALRDTLQ